MAQAYVSPPALAKEIGVCPQTVRRWARVGLIPRPQRLPSGQERWTAQMAANILTSLQGTGVGSHADDR